MRVVAAFPSSANAASALLKVAQIHETLKEPEVALREPVQSVNSVTRSDLARLS